MHIFTSKQSDLISSCGILQQVFTNRLLIQEVLRFNKIILLKILHLIFAGSANLKWKNLSVDFINELETHARTATQACFQIIVSHEISKETDGKSASF